MDGKGLKLWVENIWSKHPGGHLKKPVLLVCDQIRSHVMEDGCRAKHVGCCEYWRLLTAAIGQLK
jgi:hypothetical protein